MIILCVSCAKQASPPGGPEDKTPPEILSSIPENGSTDIDLKPDVVISFSERMNRNKIGEAVFVSPPPQGGIRLDWSGDDLKIKIVDSLTDDRTYLVTVGSSATDSHNNRLVQSYMLAFSTGSSIDSGSISGKVIKDAKPLPGTTIAAYTLSSTSYPGFIFDSLQYVTQAGSDGTFRLGFMSPGDYALFAFNDRNGDKVWNPGREDFAFPHGPAILVKTTGIVEDMNFTLFERDSSRLGIDGAKFLRSDLLKIDFSSPVLRMNLANARVFVHGFDNIDTVYASALFAWKDTTKSCVAVFDKSFESEEYYVQVDSLKNIWSICANTQPDSMLLQAPLSTDDKPPVIAETYPLQNAFNIPLDARIRYRFEERVKHADSLSGMTLIDEDSNITQLDIEQIDPFTLEFYPSENLRSGARYVSYLNLSSIVDLAGNSTPDSVYQLIFATLNEDSLGAFSGRVVTGPKTSGRLPLVFFAPVAGGGGKLLDVQSDGRFYEDVRPGEYIFYGFVDRDADGFLNSGSFDPFNYAEPALYYPDTVSVRARFETEDISLKIQ